MCESVINELVGRLLRRVDDLEEQSDRQRREIRVLQRLAHWYEEEIDTLKGDVDVLLGE